MQREQQQQLSPNQQQMVRPPVPCNVQPQQPQPGQNGSQQKTKVALQNMLSNRAMSPGQTTGVPVSSVPGPPPTSVVQPQQPPMQPQQPQQPPQRLQMINVPQSMAPGGHPQMFQQVNKTFVKISKDD